MRNIYQTGALFMAMAAAPFGFAQPAAPRARAAGVAVQSASYLGVGLRNMDAAHAKALKLKDERGAEVTEVDPGSAAGKAGIKVGDVVLGYNGQPVQDSAQLQSMIRETVPGHEVKLSIWRNGAAQTIAATIESRRMVEIGGGEPWFAVEAPLVPSMPMMPAMPGMPNLDFDIPRIQTIMRNSMLGIAGEPLGDEQQFAEFFGVKDGVLVKSVDANSMAERAGIKAGDVIVKVGDMRVGSLRELTAALRSARAKGSYTVIVVRNKKEMPLTIG